MNKIKQILYPAFIFILLVVASWILIHVLSVFGLFLAIAYPIWWMIAPKQTLCVFCRSKKDGEECPACHQVVHKSDGTTPKTFTSAIYNGLVLLVFSLLSIGIVLLEGQVLLRFGFPAPEKTVSFSVPSQQEHQIGEIFPMQIKIAGLKEAINAVSVDFSYNPQQLEVVDISTKDSFANIFIEKQIDNKTGIARFAGGLPNPGYSGTNGIFATVYLRGLKQGIATINFLPSSSVLANDGKGNNLLASFGNASYLIVPSMPDTNKKTNQKGVSLGSNVLGASTSSATQMIFYSQQQVLGASTSVQNQTQEVPQNNTDAPLTMLGRFDGFVLTTVKKLF